MQTNIKRTILSIAASLAFVAVVLSAVPTRSSYAQKISEEEIEQNIRSQQLNDDVKIKLMNRGVDFTVEREQFSIATQGSVAVDDGKIVWIRSYDEAIAQAKLTGKPVPTENLMVIISRS